jgi:Tfp pilus assembly protein PilV
MIRQLSAFSFQLSAKYKCRRFFAFLKAESLQLKARGPAPRSLGRSGGFTLVETLAAITLIMVSIVAPMALTVQSLSAAYYARDQITASNLAQEGIEAVRAVRDANVLKIAEGVTPVPALFDGIPTEVNFEVDGTKTDPSQIIITCDGGCTPTHMLINSNGVYGYAGTPTNFTRTLTATPVWVDSSGAAQEIRITSTVSWQTAAFKTRSVIVTENLYNWVKAGSGV